MLKVKQYEIVLSIKATFLIQSWKQIESMSMKIILFSLTFLSPKLQRAPLPQIKKGRENTQL